MQGTLALRRPMDAPASTQSRHVRTQAAYWGPRLTGLVALVWVAGGVIGFERALGVVTFLGFGLAVVGLVRPWLGLAGASMLCTVDAVMRVYLLKGGLLRWNTFNYWLLLVIVFAFPLLRRRRDLPVRLIQALFALLGLELFYSPDITAGVQNMLGVIAFLGLFAYAARIEHDHTNWVWLAILNGVLAGLGCLLYYARRNSLPEIDANAFSYFPITAMFVICLAFTFTAGRAQSEKLLLALAAVNYCWVFLSGSRGGMVVATVCLLYLTFEIRGLGRKFVMSAAAMLIGLVILTLFSDLQARMLDRVLNLFDSSRSVASRTSGRSDLLKGAWLIFQDYPMGVGTGGYSIHWAQVSSRSEFSGYKRGVEQTSHSAWFKTLAENGLPGCVLLGAFVWSFTYLGWRRRREGFLGLGVLVSASLGAAYFVTEFQGKGIWLLPAGATVLLYRRNPMRQYASPLLPAVDRFRPHNTVTEAPAIEPPTATAPVEGPPITNLTQADSSKPPGATRTHD